MITLQEFSYGLAIVCICLSLVGLLMYFWLGIIIGANETELEEERLNNNKNE